MNPVIRVHGAKQGRAGPSHRQRTDQELRLPQSGSLLVGMISAACARENCERGLARQPCVLPHGRRVDEVFGQVAGR
jgi:hypothetical protein